MAIFVASRPTCACTHDGDGCSFRVAWVINPHMRIGATDCTIARQQHTAFVRTLRQHARVLQLPFLHRAFDSVFMKDSVILTARGHRMRALPTTPRHAVRRDEPLSRARQLQHVADIVTPLKTPLEGGDVVIAPHRDLALLGHGVRSSVTSIAGLERFLEREVVPLALRLEGLFHLDNALTLLDDETLVFCEEAFDRESVRRLAELEFRRYVSVPVGDALRFGLNVIEVGSTIVTGSDAAHDVWRALGRKVVVAPLDQFHLAGGSASCLVARVHDLDVSAATRVAA
jgi:N-dimethylarginine dimethylaminohydrolase